MTLIIRQSRIHSYGCYTTRPIRKGTLIVEYVGEQLTHEQADDLYDDFQSTYLFGLDGGKRIIDGYGVAAFVNHSCKPNCETDQIRGKMWIIAQRDIAAGEELTYDYNLYDGDQDAPCLCGAKRCRGSLYSSAHLRKLAKKRAKAAAAVCCFVICAARDTEISDATIRSFQSHPRFWSPALNRASAGLETIVAKALHRAPADESALLAWPVVCGSAVAERTRALSFSAGIC